MTYTQTPSSDPSLFRRNGSIGLETFFLFADLCPSFGVNLEWLFDLTENYKKD